MQSKITVSAYWCSRCRGPFHVLRNMDAKIFKAHLKHMDWPDWETISQWKKERA